MTAPGVPDHVYRSVRRIPDSIPTPRDTQEENVTTLTGYCVTVTPTIMSGTVVRWFASESAMRSVDPVISASRERVCGHGGELTPEVFDAAWTAHVALKAGHDVDHLATHRHAGLFSGEYVPVGLWHACADRIRRAAQDGER